MNAPSDIAKYEATLTIDGVACFPHCASPDLRCLLPYHTAKAIALLAHTPEILVRGRRLNP